MLQLRVQANASIAEQIEELLFNCGAVSISYQDAADESILEPGIGDHPMWSNTFIQAHFTSEQAIALASKALQHQPDSDSQIVLEKIDDQDWQAKFQQQFSTMQFGRLWIYPSWEENPAPGGITLQLDPGLAFGTGHHATTHLCLQWLSQTHLQNCTLIDFGCGSGILALAAVKLGAKHTYAVDIDPQAISATLENIERNKLKVENFTVGRTNCLHNITADVIVANILAAPLIELRDTFVQHLAPKGTLLVSGVLKSQSDSIIEHYASVFTCTQIDFLDDWAAITFKSVVPT